MNTIFSPQLTLRVLAPAVDFYKKAFGVEEMRLFKNDDGSIHVAELSFGGAVFFLHEEMPHKTEQAPESLGGTSVLITLFVDDPDALMAKALATGARELSPMQSYDYGYRQGELEDPWGHHWMIQKKI